MNELLTIDLEVVRISLPVWGYILIGGVLFIMNYIKIKSWVRRLFQK